MVSAADARKGVPKEREFNVRHQGRRKTGDLGRGGESDFIKLPLGKRMLRRKKTVEKVTIVSVCLNGWGAGLIEKGFGVRENARMERKNILGGRLADSVDLEPGGTDLSIQGNPSTDDRPKRVEKGSKTTEGIEIKVQSQNKKKFAKKTIIGQGA